MPSDIPQDEQHLHEAALKGILDLEAQFEELCARVLPDQALYNALLAKSLELTTAYIGVDRARAANPRFDAFIERSFPQIGTGPMND